MWFDYPILNFIQQNIRCDFLDPIMAGLSLFAQNGIGLCVLCVIFLFPKKTRPAAAAALLAMGLSLLLGEVVIKNIVCRPRPYLSFEAYHGYAMPFTLNTGTTFGHSFPSSHSSCSFATAVCAFKVNKTTGIISLVVASLIAFSRLYNYVHFPSDVLAGAILGTALAFLVIFIFKKFDLDDKLTRIGKK